MTFTKMITEATGTSLQKRRNGEKPVGYSGRAGIRREQFDMKARTGSR
jgi:hypothetical protein